MNEVKRLRERIAAVGVNARGRREYPAEVRDDLIAFVRRRSARGQSATASAKELALNPATVIGWLRREPSSAMRLVESDLSAIEAERAELVVEIGSDLRVTGLALEQVVELVGRLR
jgi:hypothetical protein